MVQKLLSVMETPFYLIHSVILYLVSEPQARLKVREQLIQGNQKLRLIAWCGEKNTNYFFVI